MMTYLTQKSSEEQNEPLKRMLIELAKTSQFNFVKSSDKNVQHIHQWTYTIEAIKRHAFIVASLSRKSSAPTENEILLLERQIDNIAFISNIKNGTKVEVCASVGLFIKRPNNSLGIENSCNFIILTIDGEKRYFITQLEYKKEQFYEYLGANAQLADLKNYFLSIEEKAMLGEEIKVEQQVLGVILKNKNEIKI